jgi:hypothetical protein
MYVRQLKPKSSSAVLVVSLFGEDSFKAIRVVIIVMS